MAKQNKPAIRFKGFTDAWEQRKLGCHLPASGKVSCACYVHVLFGIEKRLLRLRKVDEPTEKNAALSETIRQQQSKCFHTYGYDNAMAENSFSIVKTECIYRHKPATFLEANEMIDRYINFYNYGRIQSKTGMAPLTLRHSC